GPAPATLDGLPRRVRQASLAPQLRESSGRESSGTAPAGRAADPATATQQDIERDAEHARSRMASMQRGWQRGRLHNAEEAEDTDQATGPGETAPGTTSEGDGR
ncbi:histidine kinase, partial [Streptomyces lunaelactis]|nr:histidine kinase [Streptomyces lunaelactis]